MLTPRSISFAAMDDTEVSAFLDRVIAWVVRDVLPGVKESDLREEIEVMIGG